jgi:outer membrane protein assembly factor BamB
MTAGRRRLLAAAIGIPVVLVGIGLLFLRSGSTDRCDREGDGGEPAAPTQAVPERAACESNLGYLGRAFAACTADHDGVPPVHMSVFGEAASLEVRRLKCPSSRTVVGLRPDVDSWGDYVFPAMGAKVVTGDQIVVYCRSCLDVYGETGAVSADGTPARLAARELASRLAREQAAGGRPPVAFDAAAENSGGFRGPDRDGRFPATGLLQKWPEGGPPLAWKRTIARGWTAASVAGGSVFFCGATWAGQMWSFSLDGDLQWLTSYGPEGERTQGQPRGTPVAADGRVFYASLPGVLYCLDATNGRVVWQADIAAAGPYSQSASPLVCGDKVVVSLCSRSDDVPSFAAFRRRDGALAWKGNLGPCPEAGKGWSNFHSSPILVRAGARTLVVDQFFRCLGAVDAETGEKVWTLLTTGYSASPTSHEGCLLMQGSRMLKVQDDGGVKELWTRGLGIREYGACYSHSTIAGGRLFVFTPGSVRMIDAVTGEELARTPSGGSGSLQMAEGLLYVLDGRPRATLIRPTGNALEEVSSFTPDVPGGRELYTHAVIAEGRLFLRNQSAVAVYDLRAP